MKLQFDTAAVNASRAQPKGLGPRIRPVLIATLLTLLTYSATGQTPGVGNSPPTPPQPARVPDPLGRSTPRGTITAFIRAVHRDDFVSAGRYMQVTLKQRPNTELLARDLRDLMDRYFSQAITTISDIPTGALDDGLPLDRERIGPLIIGGQSADIILVRVTDPDSGPIWLISSDSLATVPALYDSIEKTWIERVMPAPLLNYGLFGISFALWIVWSASIGIPFLLLWTALRVSIVVIRKTTDLSARRAFIESAYTSARWPFILTLTLTAHLILMPFLGFSLSFRLIYMRFALAGLVLLSTWLLRRSINLFFQRGRALLQLRRQSGTESLMLLGERLLQVFIVLVAIFIILTIEGVDTKTALAGLGIGGVAVALGAQKTVENLLGGIFLLTDKALAIGDTCSISSRIGTVEDITLRSVRLRTLEQTLLSIPAGILSQESIENFTTRGKILVQTNLPLRYDTTAEQLRSILEGIKKLLVEDPKVETQTSRIRLIRFGVRAIELELYAYILTSDYGEFLARQEILLLTISEIVEATGTGFAMSAELLHLGQNSQAADRLNRLGAGGSIPALSAKQ